MHTPHTAPEILHRERGLEVGLYTLLCLDNDVGIMNGVHAIPFGVLVHDLLPLWLSFLSLMTHVKEYPALR